MHYVLGLKQLELTTIDTAMMSAFSVDLKRGAFAMFIYCDICEPICVGDTVASLLRTAHHTTSNERGAVIHQVFDPLIYIPMCKRWVSTNGVDIRTDTGETFPFSPDTKFLMTLHFKRFLITGSQDEYLDLSDTALHVKMRIVKNNGSDITTAEATSGKICTANLTLAALFSDV